MNVESATLQSHRDGYVNLQLRGDRREALNFVDALIRQGHSVSDIQQHVIAAASAKSAACGKKAASVSPRNTWRRLSRNSRWRSSTGTRNRSAPRGRKVLVACVEGEQHDFPARLVADALDLAGYDIRFLGADVPTSSLLQVIEEEKPDLLALSITMPFHACRRCAGR